VVAKEVDQMQSPMDIDLEHGIVSEEVTFDGRVICRLLGGRETVDMGLLDETHAAGAERQLYAGKEPSWHKRASANAVEEVGVYDDVIKDLMVERRRDVVLVLDRLRTC
jgi:hypothetical protein